MAVNIKRISVLFEFFLLLTVVYSCPELCEDPDRRCDFQCIAACNLGWEDCNQFSSCDPNCRALLSNSRCDPKCNSPACLWDAFSCIPGFDKTYPADESPSNTVSNASDPRRLHTSSVLPQLSKPLPSIHPGILFTNCIEFALKDSQNHTLMHDDSSILRLRIKDPIQSTFFGNSFAVAAQGTFSICGFIIFGNPGSSITIVADLYSSVVDGSSTEISLALEDCFVGEVQTNSHDRCIECGAGYYTLYNTQEECNDCPENAVCKGSSITPNKGYWHYREEPEFIAECINPESCLGNGTCLVGYSGTLCAECDKGYVLESTNTCTKCPSMASNIILITFLSLIVIAIVCYIIYRTHEDAYEPKLYHSVLIKILMNYFQIMILTSVLKMRWPTLFYELISVQGAIGSSTGKLFSFDCLIHDASISPYFTNILLSFLTPIILGVAISVIWAIVAVLKKSLSKVFRPYITSLVVVFFIVHPAISNYNLSVFSCHKVKDNEFWNINEFGIQCYTKDYALKYYTIFILCMILWTIGMPMVAYLILRKNKAYLDLPDTKAKYGFLYHGYHSNRYYWEFIIMFRKLLTISVALLLRSSSVSLQLIFVLLILVIAFTLNYHYQPFELEELNRTEGFSILLSIICLLSGLMIEADASYSLQLILFLILVVSNVLFLCYFAKRVYQAIGHYLWAEFPGIARMICPTAPRPKIKIKEIIQKETRKNNQKFTNFEPESGFVENNSDVVMQLCGMRNYVDFYSEVLNARFTLAETESEERGEVGIYGINSPPEQFDIVEVHEPRSLYRRMFSKKKKRESVQDKINNIRRKTVKVNEKNSEEKHDI